MAKMSKTNVMRRLDQQGIAYQPIQFNKQDKNNPAIESLVYKTLVTIGKTKTHYVFVVPITSELDLKKAAQAVDEKSIQMIKEKELLPLTGYVHGGCSPIGMKHEFETVVDLSALNHERIIFSAGKVGVSVEMDPRQLSAIIPVQFSDIKIEEEVI